MITMNEKISIEEFTEELQKKYTVSLEEAYELLYKNGLTKSTNSKFISNLLREGNIDALLIGRGRVEDRKWLVNEKSLLNYIAFKTMDFAKFTEMQQQVEQYVLLKEKLQDLKSLI